MSYTTTLGYTPVFQIEKGAEDITGTFVDRTISIRIASWEGGGDADTVDIEVDDRDWRIVLPNIGEVSTTLTVSLGYQQGGLYEMGTFQIDEVNPKWPPKAIVLHGNSSGFNTALKAPMIQHFDGKTLGDIVGTIAQTAGVKPAVDPALAGIQIPFLNQNSGSGHLLMELERRFNGLAKFTDGTLSFTARGTAKTVSGMDLATVTLTTEDIASADIKITNFSGYSKVRASYLDRTNNQLVWLESNTKGSANSSVPFMVKQPYLSQEEAQAAADSRMAQLNRATKTGTVRLAKGDPSIRGGSKLTIAGTRDGVDDVYVVRCATHVYVKDQGIATDLDVYTEDGAEGTAGDEAPSTAPDHDAMAFSTAPLGQGRTGHQ